MRIAFSTTYQRLYRDINQKAEDVSRLTEMTASGSRLLKQADDPLACSQAMDFRQTIRQLDAYKKNVDFATAWNETTDSALSQTADVVLDAKNLAIQAISAQGAEETAAQIEAADQLLQQALTLANSQYQDRYIFSGRAFTTAPYEITGSAGSETIEYHGDEESLEVRVGNGAMQKVNQNGPEVFGDDGLGSSGVLQQLLDLKDALSTGDTDRLEDLIGELDTSYQNLQHQTSIVGTRLATLDEKSQMLDSLEIQEESQLSDVADADMAEVITQLQQKQTVFEAVLQVTSMVSDLNLTKYL